MSLRGVQLIQSYVTGPEAPLKGSPEEQRRWDAYRTAVEEERKSKAAMRSPWQDSNDDDDPSDPAAPGAGGDTTSSIEKSKSSALFYDPFEARRARDTDSGLRVSVLWSVGATCSAVAVFKNPLGCPLYLTAVTLLAEGDRSLIPFYVFLCCCFWILFNADP